MNALAPVEAFATDGAFARVLPCRALEALRYEDLQQ